MEGGVIVTGESKVRNETVQKRLMKEKGGQVATVNNEVASFFFGDSIFTLLFYIAP